MAFVIAGTAAAVVGGAGSIIGAGMQADAAEDAAEKQAQAAREANALQSSMWEDQKRMHEQQRADLEPWRQTGVGALGELGSADFRRDFTAADFQQDPGYAFRMQEGQKALERSAAARGGLQSGGTMKALAQYGQNFASNEYQNAYSRFNSDRDRRFGRLSSLAGLGQNANAQMGQANAQMGAAGQNYAGQVGNNMMGAANAAGAAGMASAQAWGGALSNVGKMGMDAASLGMQNNWMNKWKSNQGGVV